MRGVAGLVLLVGLVLVVWFLGGRNTEQLCGAARDPVVEHAVDESSSEPTPAIATPAPEAAPKRQSVDVLPDGPSAVLRVVRFGTDAPLPQASVHYLPSDFDARKPSPALTDELSRLDGDTEPLLQRLGAMAITDGEGRCRVPLGKHGTQVCARDGEFYGQTSVPTDVAEEQVLALRVDCTLRGMVVDADGRPAAGVRVELKLPPGEKNQMGWSLRDTDIAGRFEQPHLQMLAGEQPSRMLEVMAQVPGATSAIVQVDGCAPPCEVVLHLPATGTVSVHVKASAGAPLDPSYFVTPEVLLAAFERTPEGLENSDGFFREPNRRLWKASIAANGVAVFSHVALDRFLVADPSFLPRKTFHGPTSVQRHVEVTLEESRDDVILSATLRLPDGSVFAERPVRAGVRAPEYYEFEARTDRGGWLRCNVAGFAGKSAVLFFKSPLFGEDEPLAVELPSRILHAGVNELGELRLAPLQILIAGRVIPEAGVAIRRVQLDFARRSDQGWNQEYNLVPKWQPDGSFSVRSGIPVGTALRVQVQEASYLPVDAIEFKAGDTGIEIPLRAAGEAIATFLVDELAPLERLVFRLRRTDFRARQMDSFDNGLSADADGRVNKEWKGLTPGSYRLTVSCLGVEEPIVAIEAIQIPAGRCEDRRLVDIDLRGRVRGIEIRATGPGGDPIAGVNAFVVIRSEGADWYGFSLDSGVVKLAAASPLDLFIVAPRYETARVEGVTESRTVSLESAVDSRIRIELPSPLPDGVLLRLRLTPKLELPQGAQLNRDTACGEGVGDSLVEEVTVGIDGVAIVPARWPGTYTVSARISVPSHGQVTLGDIEPGVITLPAPGGLTLRVGQKGLEAALEVLAR